MVAVLVDVVGGVGVGLHLAASTPPGSGVVTPQAGIGRGASPHVELVGCRSLTARPPSPVAPR